jgi:hypothetical protein
VKSKSDIEFATTTGSEYCTGPPILIPDLSDFDRYCHATRQPPGPAAFAAYLTACATISTTTPEDHMSLAALEAEIAAAIERHLAAQPAPSDLAAAVDALPDGDKQLVADIVTRLGEGPFPEAVSDPAAAGDATQADMNVAGSQDGSAGPVIGGTAS